MADDLATNAEEDDVPSPFGNLTAKQMSAFETFKAKCASEGYLKDTTSDTGDDMATGICDDGTLL